MAKSSKSSSNSGKGNSHGKPPSGKLHASPHPKIVTGCCK